MVDIFDSLAAISLGLGSWRLCGRATVIERGRIGTRRRLGYRSSLGCRIEEGDWDPRPLLHYLEEADTMDGMDVKLIKSDEALTTMTRLNDLYLGSRKGDSLAAARQVPEAG